MDEQLNFFILTDDGNLPQISRFGHQSPHSLRQSVSEALSATPDNLNPQLPSLDESEFDLPSFDEFQQKFNLDRFRALIELMRFDIEDAASHADRINNDDQHPMLDGELRARIKDLRRLHRDIFATFQELMELTIALEDRRVVLQLFQHHASTFKSASSSYERKIEEARKTKLNFRIDFRENFSGNLESKFTKTLCSGDIVYSPTRLERPNSLYPATFQEPLVPPPPLIIDVNSAFPSEPIESSTKSSISHQVSSPSEAPSQLVLRPAAVLPTEDPLLPSHFLEVSNSLKFGQHLFHESSSSANCSSSTTTSRKRPVVSLAVVSPKSDHKTLLLTCEVNQVSSFEPPEPPPKLSHSTELTSSSEAPSSCVQRPANAIPRAAAFHLHTSLHSAFETSGFDEKIEKSIEVFKQSSRQNEIGEILTHSFVSETFRSLEGNCNTFCEFIQDKMFFENPPIKFTKEALNIGSLDHFDHAFIAARHVSSLLMPTQSPPQISSSALLPKRQGSANASSSDTRFQTPSLDHLAIASSPVARIRMMPSSSVQRPANVRPQAAAFHLHTPLPSAFRASSFDEKIEEFVKVFCCKSLKKNTRLERRVCFEACKKTYHQNDAGEIVTHLPVIETFSVLESNCNSSCEFIQEKQSLKNPLIEFIERASVVEPRSHTFNASSLTTSSFNIPNSVTFTARKFEEGFFQSFRAEKLFTFVDSIPFIIDVSTLAATVIATAAMKPHACTKENLKQKENLAKVVKIREDHGRKLISRLSVSSHSVDFNCVNWINPSFLMELASGWPETIPDNYFREIVKKIQKTFFGTYFILPPKICTSFLFEHKVPLIHIQRTNRNIARLQQHFENSKLSTNIEKLQVAFSSKKHILCADGHLEDFLVSRKFTHTSKVRLDLEALTLNKTSMIDLSIHLRTVLSLKFPASSSSELTTTEAPTSPEKVNHSGFQLFSSSSFKSSSMPESPSQALISSTALQPNRQGSANASTSVARFRTPFSDHFAITSPTAA